MKLVIQRVKAASVEVDGETVGETGGGLLVLIGVAHGDTAADAAFLARKTVNLRVFDDDAGRMNRSLLERGGGVLVVSQFTLYGDCAKGNRPGYTAAAGPAQARRLYEEYVRCLRAHGVAVATGIFQAEMAVSLVNEGPVTLLLESSGRERA